MKVIRTTSHITKSTYIYAWKNIFTIKNTQPINDHSYIAIHINH